jgi:hypothetical protein
MVPFEPQTLDELKARFHEAVSGVVDTDEIRRGLRPPPSREPKHVFDFDDGLRLIVSVDRVMDEEFLHVSASSNDDYKKTIKDEGLSGLVEDVLLRLSAMMGRQPSEKINAFMSDGDVLHMIFYEDDDEGFATGG